LGRNPRVASRFKEPGRVNRVRSIVSSNWWTLFLCALVIYQMWAGFQYVPYRAILPVEVYAGNTLVLLIYLLHIGLRTYAFGIHIIRDKKWDLFFVLGNIPCDSNLNGYILQAPRTKAHLYCDSCSIQKHAYHLTRAQWSC
jgi:hypothetical protein